MLDEALIHDIKKYALLKAEKEEMEYLEKMKNDNVKTKVPCIEKHHHTSARNPLRFYPK